MLAGCSGPDSLPADVGCDGLAYASPRGGDWDVYLLEGEGSTRLTEGGGNEVNPTWSPSGDRILFTSISDGNGDLYVMADDGSDVVALTSTPEFESSSDWSPDGSTVVFDRVVDDDDDLTDIDETDFTQVFVAPLGPPLGEAVQLTTGEPNAKPKWSPDGSQVVFLSWRDGNAEVYVVDEDGSHQVNLTNDPAYDVLPSWSPDGSEIAFVSDRDGHRQIYVMDADGSHPTRVTDLPESTTNPGWSSDGSHILFTVEEDPSLIYAIPSTGGEVVEITEGFTHDCRP